MSKTILRFPFERPLSAEQAAYFSTAGYELLPYTQALLSEAGALLLETPVRCGEDAWVSPEQVWKNYLAEKQPGIKVVQVGLDHSAGGDNYVHWRELPDDFESFLSKCRPARDWRPQATSGEELREIWARFRDGHDKGGFMDWFIVAARRTKIALFKLSNENASLDLVVNYLNEDPDTLEAFTNLKRRWERYTPLLSTSPMAEELSAIDHAVAQIGIGWNDCKDSSMLNGRLNAFRDSFSTIDKTLEAMEPFF